MDAIKKKIVTLSASTTEATNRAKRFEEEVSKIGEMAERSEEHVRNIQKKIQIMEGHFDACSEQLFEVSLNLEEKEKLFNNTEVIMCDSAGLIAVIPI